MTFVFRKNVKTRTKTGYRMIIFSGKCVVSFMCSARAPHLSSPSHPDLFSHRRNIICFLHSYFCYYIATTTTTTITTTTTTTITISISTFTVITVRTLTHRRRHAFVVPAFSLLSIIYSCAIIIFLVLSKAKVIPCRLWSFLFILANIT